MLDVGLSELKSAFYLHGKNSKRNSGASDFLLLFYAVECGLKAAILKANRLMKASQLTDKFITHDLHLLIKELKLSAPASGINANFRIHRDHSSWAVEYAHQAWRYGVEIIEVDQTRLITWLNALQKEIAGRI
jgi:hypothetical protein